MTEIIEAEKVTAGKMVLVEAQGITTAMGFNVEPEGYQPSYVGFAPGKPSQTRKEYADFLVKMDPSRFKIVGEIAETPKVKTAEKTEDDTVAQAASKKTAKKAAKAVKAPKAAKK